MNTLRDSLDRHLEKVRAICLELCTENEQLRVRVKELESARDALTVVVGALSDELEGVET